MTTGEIGALVIAGPGTNRDAATVRALSLAGARAETRTAAAVVGDPSILERSPIVAIAGGFSHADALGAGRMLALELMHDAGGAFGAALRAFVADGGLVIGICNGFQVLTRCGLLPGALGHNDHGRFECSWVELEPVSSRSVWLQGWSGTIECPIAHGEGRYVHPDPARLAADGQVALRYVGRNPNGSVDAIAGVCDETGRVLGLMPHPEDHVIVEQHPDHLVARSAGRDRTDEGLGLALFRAGVDHVRREMAR